MPRGRPLGSKAENSKWSRAQRLLQESAEEVKLLIDDLPSYIANMSPLEAMLISMKLNAYKGNWDLAASIAKDAAPYVHPRLVSTQLTGKDGDALQIQTIRRLIVDAQTGEQTPEAIHRVLCEEEE